MAAGRAIAEWFVRIGADTSDMTAGMKQAEKSMSGLQTAVKIGAGLIASHYATMAAGAAVDLAQMAAQHDRLETSMGHLADQYGGDADAILASLKRASGGTISETELILNANRAMMLQLGADSDKLAQLMEVARYRGRAMGLSTTQAFSDIVTGIGRMSPMILDNLGIIVDSETAYADYAASIGKAGDALTDVEKRQALLNTVLREGQAQLSAAGPLVDDAADSFAELSVKIQEAKLQLGEIIAPTVISGVEALSDAIDRLSTGRGARAPLMGDIDTAPMEELLSLQGEFVGKLEMLKGRQALFEPDSMGWRMLNDDIRATERQLGAITDEINDRMVPGTNALGEAWNGIPAQVDEVSEAVNRLSRAISPELQELMGRNWSLVDPESYDYDIRKWNERNDATERGNELLEQRQRDMESLALSTYSATSAYDDFASVIEGLMSPTSVTQWDTMATDLGRYVDKWDEHARRLEDVKQRGLASPWASLVGDAASDQEAKLKAMQQQRDFYDFLDPASIDRDALLEQYNRYRQGEANKRALINELAAMAGGTATEAAGFLGVEAPELAAGDFLGGFTSSINDYELVSPLAQRLRDDVTTNNADLKDAGRRAGDVVLEGITGAVVGGSQSVINKFATAIAPEVAAILNWENAR